MKISFMQIPDLSQDLEVISSITLSDDVSILLVFKNIYRDENTILLDVYQDDISEINKIVSGVLLTSDTLLFNPNSSDFRYYIYCLDSDGVKESINPQNANKFYLQFVSLDDGKPDLD